HTSACVIALSTNCSSHRSSSHYSRSVLFFFFNAPTTTHIYTLSLHDALPISPASPAGGPASRRASPSPTGSSPAPTPWASGPTTDRKSTRLNSSHLGISYAVFCLKKKKTTYSISAPSTHTGSISRHLHIRVAF